MNEEEKKAIEKLTNGEFVKITIQELMRKMKKEGVERFVITRPEYIYTILNLIEKLQKENEELRGLIAHKNGYTKKLEEDLFENCSNYVVSIQKVKDKIEEYKKMLLSCNKFFDVDRIKAINERILELQELIEEKGE